MSGLRTMLAETAARLFADHVAPDTLRAAEEGTWPEALWAVLEAGGLTHALVPEALGGAGASWGDTYVLVRAAGRAPAPVPLAETLVAGWLLGRAGLPAPPGPLTIGRELLAVDRDRVSGVLRRVPWGARAGHVVALGRAGDALRLVCVPTGDADVRAGESLACEPRDDLAFEPTHALVADAGGLEATAIEGFGALVRAGQMAGALEGLVAQSVAYANARVQFGRPIGKFQAIQHQLAVLAEHAAATAVAAEVAFRAADGDDPGIAVATAKTIAGDAADVATAIAHQVHGAIGFTDEHALHFTTRRLWAWRTEFGGATRWAAAIGRAAVAGGAAGLWPWITRGGRP